MLALPIPDAKQPRYWIGLHESWVSIGKRKCRFIGCGLRIYAGERSEPPIQILRLEWAGPTINPDVGLVYDGGHAGHPHWHIDRAAVVGEEDYRRSLEILTRPVPAERPVETFDPSTTANDSTRRVADCSWLPQIHLPAHAAWMLTNWNGKTLPGPHQSNPKDLLALNNWWEGALRYVRSELGRHAQ